MRAALFLSCFLVGACASGAPAPVPLLPNWSGPAVHARHLGDRGLEVELVAPSAGHSFELCSVEISTNRVDLHFVHRTPGEAFVAQVVTPLRVTVDAARLGEARAVFVWIATVAGTESPPPADQLALVLARP
jgi:hypothetical protein